MRKFDLRKLQLTELEILKEIDRVCRKHHIIYYLGWGSALGAIRHNGFIPWDDDIDIVMEYDQYLMFKEVCREELGKKYYYQDCLDGSDYYLHYAKIRMNKTCSMSKKEKELKMHWGICIDIFPLYSIKHNHETMTMKLKRKYFQFLCQKPSRLASFQTENIKKKLFRFLYSFFSDETLRRKKEKLMSSFRSSKDYEYLIDSSDSEKQIILKKDVFGNGVIVPFEDSFFPVPAKYDEYLKTTYGDNYMEIPSAENHVNHGDILIEFEQETNNV